MKNNTIEFWLRDNENIKISHSKLINFIENKGFQRVKLSDVNYILIKSENNIIRDSSEEEVIAFVSDYLIQNKQYDVNEKFVSGVGSYISQKKLYFLKSIDLINDRDTKESSKFFYQNCFCTVTKDSIEMKEYTQLENVIWKNRLIQFDFNFPNSTDKGQFERFCENITHNDPKRLQALQSILGYLLHRNKYVGEPKAVILYDENMGKFDQAHGGTGKTLLSLALAKCREAIMFDGKDIKTGSWFKNQRINITSDLLIYDDLNKEVRFENFFSMITSGIEVEKKRQHSFYIDSSRSPKILISSNYYVKGPGGASDLRRRHEFELSNHYSEEFTPEMDFGNRFFEEHWTPEEWNMFFLFMMNCVNVYLEKGLIVVEPINLYNAKTQSATSENFVEFANTIFEYNEWLDKKEYLEMFQEEYPEDSTVSSHKFTKWITDYSIETGCVAEHKSAGSKNLFMIRKLNEDGENKARE